MEFFLSALHIWSLKLSCCKQPFYKIVVVQPKLYLCVDKSWPLDCLVLFVGELYCFTVIIYLQSCIKETIRIFFFLRQLSELVACGASYSWSVFRRWLRYTLDKIGWFCYGHCSGLRQWYLPLQGRVLLFRTSVRGRQTFNLDQVSIGVEIIAQCGWWDSILN